MTATPVANLPDRRPVIAHGPDDLVWTLAIMDRLMREDALNPWLVHHARRVILPAIPRQAGLIARERAACQAVWRWVVDHLEYVQDPFDRRAVPGNAGGDAHAFTRPTEYLADSENVIRTNGGDCDELTVVTGALLLAVPLDPRARFGVELWVCGPDHGDESVPVHVYPMAVLSDGTRIAVDTTLRPPAYGMGAVAGADQIPPYKHWRYEPAETLAAVSTADLARGVPA